MLPIPFNLADFNFKVSRGIKLTLLVSSLFWLIFLQAFLKEIFHGVREIFEAVALDLTILVITAFILVPIACIILAGESLFKSYRETKLATKNLPNSEEIVSKALEYLFPNGEPENNSQTDS